MGQEFVDIKYDDFAENQTSIAKMSKVCRFLIIPRPPKWVTMYKFSKFC